MKQPKENEEAAAPIPGLDDSPLMTEVVDRGVNKIANGETSQKEENKPTKTPKKKEKEVGKVPKVPPEPAFPDDDESQDEDQDEDDIPEYNPQYAHDSAEEDDLPVGALPGEGATASNQSDAPARQNLNHLFAESLFGSVKHFLPVMLHSQTKIRETDIMILTKEGYLPEGSLKVVNEINDRNHGLIKKEVAQYEEEITKPLKAMLATWEVTVTPEISLLMAFLGMGVGLFSLSRNIARENRIAINEFMRQYQKEQEKKED